MKRVLSLLLAAVIMMMSTTHIAAVTSEESYAGNQLRILGILRGYDDGTLKLNQPILRAEVAALTVRILGYEHRTVEGEGRAFIDVDETYWAYPVIQNAAKLKVISGYPDMTFKPMGQITYGEVVAIMVNALGKQNDLQGTWPDNYLNKAKAVGIIPADSTVDPNKVITRGEMSVIVWRTLLVKE